MYCRKATPVSQLDPGIRRQSIGEIDIDKLRTAIRANWVSFPSQVPTFPTCGRTDVQRRLIQLYFLLGWRCSDIAARYGLLQGQVRAILITWKWRAANAGYIQHIPV
jgi:hypothetical protein